MNEQGEDATEHPAGSFGAGPRDGTIDFARYSTEQLEELQFGIDRRAFPQNFANLSAELQRRAASGAAQPVTRIPEILITSRVLATGADAHSGHPAQPEQRSLAHHGFRRGNPRPILQYIRQEHRDILGKLRLRYRVSGLIKHNTHVLLVAGRNS